MSIFFKCQDPIFFRLLLPGFYPTITSALMVLSTVSPSYKSLPPARWARRSLYPSANLLFLGFSSPFLCLNLISCQNRNVCLQDIYPISFLEGAWHGGFDFGLHFLKAETKGSIYVSLTRVWSVCYQALFSSVCECKVVPWSLGGSALTGEMSVSHQSKVAVTTPSVWSQLFPADCSKVSSSCS